MKAGEESKVEDPELGCAPHENCYEPHWEKVHAEHKTRGCADGSKHAMKRWWVPCLPALGEDDQLHDHGLLFTEEQQILREVLHDVQRNTYGDEIPIQDLGDIES